MGAGLNFVCVGAAASSTSAVFLPAEALGALTSFAEVQGHDPTEEQLSTLARSTGASVEQVRLFGWLPIHKFRKHQS